MDIEFNSLEELYKRVTPALRSKVREFKIYNYTTTEEMIWTFLAETTFVKSKKLTLSDVVSSIMHVNLDDLKEYVLSKKM